nr:Integrase/Recombinase [Clostridium novyi A str. 4540]
MVKNGRLSNAEWYQKEKIYIMEKYDLEEKEIQQYLKLIRKLPRNYKEILIEFAATSSVGTENKKPKSQNTIESYLIDLVQFIRYLINKRKTIFDIKAKDIELYKNYLLNKERLKVKTINRKLTSINQFLKFNHLEVNVQQISEQKQNYLDNILNKNEIEKLLKACKNNKRDKAIIETLYLTGVRVSELIQIRVQDVNKKSVTIRGKNNKYRDIFVTKKLSQAWHEYLDVREECSCEQLFVGKRGPLKKRTINKIIRKYAEKAGVKKSKAHPHNFRHAFCKGLADRGVNIETIADIAGHSDLNTTRIYTRQTKEELIDILEEM